MCHMCPNSCPFVTIGIDARFFGPKSKGLGRYTQKLVENLEKIDFKNQYVIFLRKENFKEYQPQNQNFKKILTDYRWYSLAEQIFMPIEIYRQEIDLMHFPHFNAPIFYFGKFVVTIHDLILRHFPTRRASTLGFLKYWLKNLAYKIVIWLAIYRAKKIIVPSEYVKKDIVSSFGVNERKIFVTYEGVPDILNSPQPSLESREGAPPLILRGGWGELNKFYLLYVGNAYPHKNLENLIRAFEILVKDFKKDIQLVLVGEKDYFYKRLENETFNNCHSGPVSQYGVNSSRNPEPGFRVEHGMTNIGNRVIFAGFVPDDELDELYKNASLYVFPSLCEGFGLPPLEAMSHGVPVLSSSATCLPEILGNAAIYFDAKNPQDMVKKINKVLEDDNLRQELISHGYEQVKKYSWGRMAEQTLQVYQDTIRY